MDATSTCCARSAYPSRDRTARAGTFAPAASTAPSTARRFCTHASTATPQTRCSRSFQGHSRTRTSLSLTPCCSPCARPTASRPSSSRTAALSASPRAPTRWREARPTTCSFTTKHRSLRPSSRRLLCPPSRQGRSTTRRQSTWARRQTPTTLARCSATSTRTFTTAGLRWDGSSGALQRSATCTTSRDGSSTTRLSAQSST